MGATVPSKVTSHVRCCKSSKALTRGLPSSSCSLTSVPFAGWSVSPRTQRIFANLEWMVILRFCTSMVPSRWNSLITFETASRVEAIMFASS